MSRYSKQKRKLLIIGKIDCVGLIGKKSSPFRSEDFSRWSVVGSSEETAKPNRKIVKGIVPSDAMVERG